MPLVTVILTTHNRYKTFLKSYESIIEQTYKNLEIIIVDDFSTTEDYLNLSKDFFDERTTYIRHPFNQGLAKARNTGIKKSNGQFIGFCDDDDLWIHNKIELQLASYYSSPAHVGVITSSTKVVVDNKSFIRRSFINGWFYRKMIGAKQPLGNGSTLLFTRKCIESIGYFDEKFKRGVDGEYLYRVSLKYKVKSVDLPLVIYNFDSDIKRITNNKSSDAIKRDIISLINRLRSDRVINGKINLSVFRLYLKIIKRLMKLKKYKLIKILVLGKQDKLYII